MRLVERSYGGKAFRPRPEISCDESNEVAFIVFPWGSRSPSRKAIQTMADHILAATSDQEATTPFEQNPSLTPTANSLRSALLLANDQIYREDNRDEYQVGLEITAIAVHGEEVCIAQVGGASIFLGLPGFELTPICTTTDHALFRSSPNETLTPLPSDLVGVTPSLAIRTYSFKKPAHSSLILIARTFVPARTLAIYGRNHSLEEITRELSRQSPDMPFWIAQVTMS